MAKERKFSFAECEEIYEQLQLGYTQAELASEYGVAQATISRAKRRFERELRREEERMAQAEVVVAGDKENGRLVLTSTDGKRFDGYRKRKGKMEKKRFEGSKSQCIEDWQRWRDEEEPDWVSGGRAEVVQSAPEAQEEPEVVQEVVQEDKIYCVYFTGQGGKFWLFRDMTTACSVADSLNSALEQLDIGEYTVEEAKFWE